MNNKIELLAPAGDYDAFLAAVENGADAVYLGGKLLNARQFAGNFDSEELKKAINYAHVRGIKVYLTANTLITDTEMTQALDLVEKAYLMGIDGVIVQDIGFAGLIRKIFPNLDLHASTQMTIYNLEGIQLLEKLGFKRAVLARELSIQEIGSISADTSLEIEVFVHGALCICYSGQCLMSSIIGGRSGNRGKCAQPCRLSFELINSKSSVVANRVDSINGYLLSPKDICSIDLLGNIMDAGVKSLKIEGRMKSPEYVATVVRIYRKYLDRLANSYSQKSGYKVDTDDIRDLSQIFNRGGLSNGYLVSKTGKDMMCYEKPKNWGLFLGEVLEYDRFTNVLKIETSEKISIGDGIEVWNGEAESPGTIVSEIKINGRNTTTLNKGGIGQFGYIKGKISKGDKVYKTSDKDLNLSARETYTGKARKKIPIEGKFTVEENSPIKLFITDSSGNEFQAEGATLPQIALNRPLTGERAMEQLMKTGSTPFEFLKIEILIQEKLTVPISEINDLRRRAIEGIEAKRVRAGMRIMSREIAESRERLLYFPGNSRIEPEDFKISIYYYDFDKKVDILATGADRVYIPFKAFLDRELSEHFRYSANKGVEIFVQLPPITKGNYDDLIKKRLKGIFETGIDGIMIGNIGSLKYVQDLKGIEIVGDHTLNAFNSHTISEMNSLGLKGITISPELTLNQIKAFSIPPDFSAEAIVYGRLRLMNSENCPVGSTAGGMTVNTDCNKACAENEFMLRDRKGVDFPVLCDRIDCRSTVLNSNVLLFIDEIDRLKSSGIGWMRLNIWNEEPEKIKNLAQMYKYVLRNGEAVVGKYGGLIDEVKQKGFTKGHYFRGV